MSGNNHTASHTGHHSIASMGMLIGVFGALLLLTFITVAIADVDFGSWNLLIAMLVATVKACLVAWFFMHLQHDSSYNRLIFFSSFVFVLLFVSFVLLDTGQYQHQLDWEEKVLKQAH